MRGVGPIISNLSTGSFILLFTALGMIVLAVAGFGVWAIWYRRIHRTR
jgi:hypothetical protein